MSTNSIEAGHLMAFIERIERTLVYDRSTGNFRRRIAYGRYAVDSLAGTPCANGYISIGIDGHRYKAHRLAWLLSYRRWPNGDVDHIDRNRANNAIDNLREATRSQNLANATVRKDSGTGFRGVSYTRSGRFSARLMVQGDSIYLGTFETSIEAASVYARSSAKINGDFARTA